MKSIKWINRGGKIESYKLPKLGKEEKGKKKKKKQIQWIGSYCEQVDSLCKLPY